MIITKVLFHPTLHVLLLLSQYQRLHSKVLVVIALKAALVFGIPSVVWYGIGFRGPVHHHLILHALEVLVLARSNGLACSCCFQGAGEQSFLRDVFDVCTEVVLGQSSHHESVPFPKVCKELALLLQVGVGFVVPFYYLYSRENRSRRLLVMAGNLKTA